MSFARFCRSVTLGLSLTGALAVGAEKPETKPRDASFRFLKFAVLPELCTRNAAGRFEVPDAFPGFIGRPVRLRIGAPIPLYRTDGKTGGPAKHDGELAPPLLDVTPLEAPRQLVVLFGDESKPVASVIPDNPARFPFGRVLAVNLTSKPIRAAIGDVATVVPAGGSVVCGMPKQLGGTGNVAVQLFGADMVGRRLYSSMWPYDTKVRTLAFFYENTAGRLIVRTVLDAHVPELAEAREDPASAR